MGRRSKITCINKRGSHLDPHERIEYIGNQSEGWRMSEADAIRGIEGGTHTFYTLVNGREAEIIVAEHKGRKYLKTEADGYAPNNLLSLAECKDCKNVV
jgi:hypothetical protein